MVPRLTPSCAPASACVYRSVFLHFRKSHLSMTCPPLFSTILELRLAVSGSPRPNPLARELAVTEAAALQGNRDSCMRHGVHPGLRSHSDRRPALEHGWTLPRVSRRRSRSQSINP